MAIENLLGLSTWTMMWIGIAVVVIIVAVVMKKRG
jgi:hypothetical protein